MEINLNSQVYSLEAILKTCYNFLDRVYLFLDFDEKRHRIKIFFDAKKKFSAPDFKKLRGDFLNELLHVTSRYHIVKNNGKIRQYIVGKVLYDFLPDSASK